jgi:class 3 adenylate cyclase
MTFADRSRPTHKNLETPDELRQLGRGSGVYVDIGKGFAIGKAILQPGWRWSIDIKPVVGTPSCQVHHLQLILAGHCGLRMDAGDEYEFGPNDVIDIPPGHDFWVVGDEPLVLMDMSGNSPDFGLAAPHSRTVLTMLMTDIVDSTKTAGQLGDAAWKQRLGDHNRIVRHELQRFDGREIDTTGDGFLAAFASAEAALRAALSIQHAIAAAAVQIRAGVHTGEVDVLEGGDLRGIAVHETARIMAVAPGGSVYTSAISRALANGRGLQFKSTGTHPLKGFDVPVELFEVEGSSPRA